jgi:hypothetical protein
MSLIFVLFVTLKANGDVQKSHSSILMQLEQERNKGKEMRKLLIKKNNKIEALEYQLAERAPKEYTLKLVEEHERVTKEQENVIQKLMEILSQRDKSISERHDLVNNLNTKIRELISFKPQRDRGEYEAPHCVILSITMLVHHFLIANILLSTLFLKDSIRFLSFF